MATKINRPQIPSRAGSLERGNQIAVLAAEYAAREQEKNSAAQGILNGLAIAVGLLVGLLTAAQGRGNSVLWVAFPPAILLFLMMETDRQFSVLYHSTYISLLEERINELAGRSLLQWERHGSSYHTIIGKPRLHNRQTNAKRFNWGFPIQAAYVVFAAVAFFYSLFQAACWLLTRYEGPVAPLLYALPQLLILMLLVIRAGTQKGTIQFIKEDLRARLFPELREATPNRLPDRR